MDISLLLILMAILYIVPEILKRRRPPKYEYPEVPDVPTPRQPQPPVKQTKHAGKKHYQIPDIPAVQEKYPVHKPQLSLDSLETKTPVKTAPEVSAWHGTLSSSMVVNGIIFAEIIQPPRSKRPLRPIPSLKHPRH